jgi:TonB family protein
MFGYLRLIGGLLCAAAGTTAAAQVTAQQVIDLAGQAEAAVARFERAMADRTPPWPAEVTSALGEVQDRLLVSWAMCLDVSADDIARSAAPPAESIESVALERCAPILRGYRRAVAAGARSQARDLREDQLDELVRSATSQTHARLLTRTRQLAAPPPPRLMSPPLPGLPPPSGSATAPPVRAQLRTPVPQLITSRDYPAAALRAGVEGLVRVRLEISRRGRVARCTIVQSSGSELLDTATCGLLQARARFKPARNARGRTVGDSALAPVRWVIPND